MYLPQEQQDRSPTEAETAHTIEERRDGDSRINTRSEWRRPRETPGDDEGRHRGGPRAWERKRPSAQAGSFRFQTENASGPRRGVGASPRDRSSAWGEADRIGNRLPQRRPAGSLPNGVRPVDARRMQMSRRTCTDCEWWRTPVRNASDSEDAKAP